MAAPRAAATRRMAASRADSLGDEAEDVRSINVAQVGEALARLILVDGLEPPGGARRLDDDVLRAVTAGNSGHGRLVAIWHRNGRATGHQVVARRIANNEDV